MPDDRPPPNPLRGVSLPSTRPTAGSRASMRPFASRSPIPVLDHRKSPAPWSSPYNERVGDGSESGDEAAPVLSPAEHARTIVGSARNGVLATVVGDPAAPITFVVNFSTAEDGSPVVCIRNSVKKLGHIFGNVSASFSVAETPLTAVHSSLVAGVTMAGTLQEITRNEINAYLPSHARVHSGDELIVKRDEAQLFLLQTVAVLVSGRSQVARVNFAEFSNAKVDPLAAVAPGLAQHLAGDENGSLVLLARAYGNQPDAKLARLMGIDRLGMDLMVKTSHGSDAVRLGFPNPVGTPEEVRKELNTMIRGARFKLGG